MKRTKVNIVFRFMVGCLFLGPSASMALDCRSDSVVRDWIVERDNAEKRVLKQWATGAPAGEYADGVGIIVSSELFIGSSCRSPAFLKQNLHFLGVGGKDLRVETVPCIILERLMGKDILSPHRNFPKKEGLR